MAARLWCSHKPSAIRNSLLRVAFFLPLVGEKEGGHGTSARPSQEKRVTVSRRPQLATLAMTDFSFQENWGDREGGHGASCG